MRQERGVLAANLLGTRRFLLALIVPALALPAGVAGAELPPGTETLPVVLTGAQLAPWAAPGDVTVHPGTVDGTRCQAADAGVPEPFGATEVCTHNRYEDPAASSQAVLAQEGAPVDQLLAYRWITDGFLQIPFQVDEVFTRYLSNHNSGFSVYSETDGHTAYAFDREGFRFTASDAADPCRAVAEGGVATTPDPVPGLDTDDELVFMARDAGAQAPPGLAPEGVADVREVAVTVGAGGEVVGYVYVALAGDEGPAPAFDATNGYVRYERDADADVFRFSESSYENYGAAAEGPYRDAATGECVGVDDPEQWRQRRPADGATIATPRYRYRYDGRWLMTDVRVSSDPDGDWAYGTDLVDRWKARAFQQRPGGETPCCGYEEEDNNWGGSSILMGERAGPVRVVRETWGADSGTNVVRREIFYRDEVRLQIFLRVHVIPPLDGIYAQWDYNAGAVATYFNPQLPEGVAIDGRDDEAIGNSRVHLGSDGVAVHDPGLPQDIVLGSPDGPCEPDGACVNNDVDTADPMFSGVNTALQWEQIAGPNGTLVSRWSLTRVNLGAAQAAAALPYYRDDACFDDGTGSNPGPHLHRRGVDDGEFAQYRFTLPDGTTELRPRECWDVAEDGTADLGTERFFQGSIGTHGIHLLLIADSDNARTTLPLTEIDAEQRMVVLPPTLANVGETYGRHVERPVTAVVTPIV